MELRKTATACLAAVILTAGSAAFAQSGTGNTGNPSNDPATIQDPGMAPAGQGAGVSGGTGNTGNPTNDPALLQQDVTGSTTGQRDDGRDRQHRQPDQRSGRDPKQWRIALPERHGPDEERQRANGVPVARSSGLA